MMAARVPTPSTHTVRQILQDALGDFQSILTNDEICELHKAKAVPDADAVLIFTAQLDSLNRTRKGPSIASRLYPVLQSVRDFCSVIDTFVSSHPEVAALLWGSVKLTMVIATAVLSSFEALSKLFLELGKLCPFLSEYATLYPASKRLQQSLSEFHGSIIRYCKHVVEVIRRPWHSQLLMGFTDEFRSDADAIREYSRTVQDELSLAKARANVQSQHKQEIERKAASEGRQKMVAFFSRTEQDIYRIASLQMKRDGQQTREWRQRLLDVLSTHDYLTPLKQSRRERYWGTGQWIFHTQEYERWINGTSPLLWCDGKIGSGKTVIAASIIDHLLTNKNSLESSVSFFFIRFDDPSSLKADTIFRSILRQRLNSNFSSELETRLALLNSYSDTCEMLDLIGMTFTLDLDSHYIVVDGLDECSKASRHDILEALFSLATRASNVKIALFGRESVSGEVGRTFTSLEHLSMDCAAANSDINTYIENIIDEKVACEELIVTQDGLVHEIKRALVKGANGMFLWVFFQIQQICSQHCDEDIRRAIENLPQDITETFQRATHRILSRGQKKSAERVFQWIAGAKRPLNLDEMQEALAIEIGQKYSRPERLYNDLHKVTLWCENLVRVDEEFHLVQFAHRAVLQFFLEEPSDSRFHFHLNLEDLDHEIGEVCVSYLNFSDFNTALVQRSQPLPPSNLTNSRVPISPMHLAQTALTHGSRTSIISRIFRAANSKSGSRSISLNLTAETATPEIIELKHPFMRYACVFWIHHTTRFRRWKSQTWGLWECILKGNSAARMPWGTEVFDTNNTTALDWAYENSHYALIYYAISCDFSDAQIWRLVHKCDIETLKVLISDIELRQKLEWLFLNANEHDIGVDPEAS